jgi:hypothetical protein
MKKLLSVVAILILAGALLPTLTHAGLRGAFDPLTNGSGFVNGSEQGALRNGNNRVSATAGTTERYFAMTTRSMTVGSETVRELWLHENVSQAGFVLPLYKQKLLVDPAALISYADPVWSPNGDFLAYVKTDKNVTFGEIWVQQFTKSTTITSVVATGPATLVVGGGPGVINRRPHWDPTGTKLVFDSNVAGSIDLYTVDVFPAVGMPNRITFNGLKAEMMAAWSPDGTRVAYATNEFGPFIIKILDLSTVPHPTDGASAEANFAPVTHLNPAWSSVAGENVIYYDAPAGEDVNAPTNIWRLDLNTQAKCQISIDARGDYDVDVSRLTNQTRDAIKYNYLIFSSTGANMGLNMWRANYVQSCVAPLPMGIAISPATWNLGSGGPVDVDITFPPETNAAGYQAQSFNGPLEGVRMRTSIVISPTMWGLAARVATHDCRHQGICGAPFPDYEDKVLAGIQTINCRWDRRTMEARMIALGLVDQEVPVTVEAYSNVVGRTFRGYGIVGVSTSNLSGSAVRLLQNSPNPFNPMTKITFANSKAGNVELRIFNVRGELVKTLAKQWFPQGEHTLSWDGSTEKGARASSGMYYAQVKSSGATDKIKMMLME